MSCPHAPRVSALAPRQGIPTEVLGGGAEDCTRGRALPVFLARCAIPRLLRSLMVLHGENDSKCAFIEDTIFSLHRRECFLGQLAHAGILEPGAGGGREIGFSLVFSVHGKKRAASIVDDVAVAGIETCGGIEGS